MTNTVYEVFPKRYLVEARFVLPEGTRLEDWTPEAEQWTGIGRVDTLEKAVKLADDHADVRRFAEVRVRDMEEAE